MIAIRPHSAILSYRMGLNLADAAAAAGSSLTAAGATVDKSSYNSFSTAAAGVISDWID